MSPDLKVRRPEPSWVATLVVILAIVGYCVYTGARLRSAIPSAMNGSRAPAASSTNSASALDVPR